MKIVFTLIGLIVVLGAVYALAFFGIIPAQKIADKNAGARSFLKAIHLAKDPPKPKAVVAQATGADLDNPIKKIADERAKLDADKAALDDEKAAFEREKAAVPAATAASTGDSRDKLISIYGTMDPDSVAQIMTHVPDKSVLADLEAMDEKRAGKVLAALPADRAAKLSELMTLPGTTKPAPAPTATASNL